jgi:hypothetical protein
MAICNVVQLIEPQQCIGDSLPIINDNFANLNSSACQLETKVNDLSSTISAGITNYINESTFVYAINTSGDSGIVGTQDLTNQWQNVYTSPSKTPLRITVPAAPFARKAAVTARLYVRKIETPFTTFWARLGRFSNATEVAAIPTAPLEVLSVGCNEPGGTGGSSGHPITLEQYYKLEPNTIYHFGLQTYFTATYGTWGWCEINGWHTWFLDGPLYQGQGSTLRNPDPNNYSHIYAAVVPPVSPSVILDVPGTFEAGDTSLKCSSYIKVSII